MAPSQKRMNAVAAAIGERIATLRRAAGMTQAELAERVGSTAAVLSRVETGRELASVQRMIEIAGALGCELPDLVATTREASDPREAVIAEVAALVRGSSIEDAQRAGDVVRALLKR